MTKLVDSTTYSRKAARATSDQIAAWRALARAFAAARERMAAALQGSGLDLSEYDVLVTLAEGPAEGVRPTDLAGRVLMTKSGITRLLDRLQERDLIARVACPTDGRSQFIALTTRGRSVLRRAAPSLLRALAATLAPLTGAELAALQRTAARIAVSVEGRWREV
jgi:DNA-binding MarR family transcriptional regulator